MFKNVEMTVTTAHQKHLTSLETDVSGMVSLVPSYYTRSFFFFTHAIRKHSWKGSHHSRWIPQRFSGSAAFSGNHI